MEQLSHCRSSLYWIYQCLLSRNGLKRFEMVRIQIYFFNSLFRFNFCCFIFSKRTIFLPKIANTFLIQMCPPERSPRNTLSNCETRIWQLRCAEISAEMPQRSPQRTASCPDSCYSIGGINHRFLSHYSTGDVDSTLLRQHYWASCNLLLSKLDTCK